MSPLYLVTIKTSALQSNLMVVPARACTFQLRQMTHTKTSKAAKKEARSQGCQGIGHSTLPKRRLQCVEHPKQRQCSLKCLCRVKW